MTEASPQTTRALSAQQVLHEMANRLIEAADRTNLRAIADQIDRDEAEIRRLRAALAEYERTMKGERRG